MISIGSRIVFRRNQLRLKAKELAQLVGCHPPDISDWENDKTTPSAESLIKLAKALKTSESWLLSGTHPRLPKKAPARKRIRYSLVESGTRDLDNGSKTKLEEEMLKDKDYIIHLQKEKIRELEARLEKLEPREDDSSSKKSAG